MSFYGEKQIAREPTKIYVVVTILFSFLLTMFIYPWAVYLPNFLILTIAWWSMRKPEVMTLTVAVLLGFFIDIIHDKVMGVSMMQYLIIAYLTCNIKQRIQIYNFIQQNLVMLFIFILATFIPNILVNIFLLQSPKYIDYWSAIFSGFIWFPFVMLIVAPQYKPVRDEAVPHQNIS